MTSDQAKVVLQFLARVQLNGAEVPAFTQVVTAIQKFVEPEVTENVTQQGISASIPQ